MLKAAKGTSPGSRTTSIYAKDYPKHSQGGIFNPSKVVLRQITNGHGDGKSRNVLEGPYGSTAQDAAKSGSMAIKSPRFIKRRIIPSSSGFTIDIEHIQDNRRDTSRFPVYMHLTLADNRGQY